VVTRVTSNGLLVPARLADLRHATSLKISVDGPEDVHDGLRGRGSHRAARDAVVAAQGAGIPAQLNAVLSAPLLPKLDRLLADARALGVSVTFQLPEDRGAGVDELAPAPAELRLAISRLLALRAAADPVVGNSPGTLAMLARWPDPPTVDCHAGLRFCRVLAGGRVVACDRPQAPPASVPVPDSGCSAGFAALRKAGACTGCWRNNTLEINRLLGGQFDSLAAVGRWIGSGGSSQPGH